MYEVPRHLPDLETINADGSSTKSLRERALSNFSPHPFTLAGHSLANVEAFVQGIKYPEDTELRQRIFQLAAPKAKRLSPEKPPELIKWNGQTMRYKSYGHYLLQATAILSKFDQNEAALELLLATGNLPITHDLGRPEKPTTCLPEIVFTRILDETRTYFFAEMGKYFLDDFKEPHFIIPAVVAYARNKGSFPG